MDTLARFGFTRIEKAFSSSDLDFCESEISSLMTGHRVTATLMKTDMSGRNDLSKSDQIEFKRPSLISRKLRTSNVFTCCRRIANSYFGGRSYYLFDHAIYKLPRGQTITPWHQDQAYLGSTTTPSLHFWIPFQDTDSHNGTLQFVKENYYEMLPHESAYATNSHTLKVRVPPQRNIHTLKINRGDVSLHTPLTLHSSLPNNSDEVRKVWIIHFGPKPEWHKHWLKLKTLIRLPKNRLK